MIGWLQNVFRWLVGEAAVVVTGAPRMDGRKEQALSLGGGSLLSFGEPRAAHVLCNGQVAAYSLQKKEALPCSHQGRNL